MWLETPCGSIPVDPTSFDYFVALATDNDSQEHAIFGFEAPENLRSQFEQAGPIFSISFLQRGGQKQDTGYKLWYDADSGDRKREARKKRARVSAAARNAEADTSNNAAMLPGEPDWCVEFEELVGDMSAFAEQTVKEMELTFVEGPRLLAEGCGLFLVIRWMHAAMDMHRCASELLPRRPPSQQRRDSHARYEQAREQLLAMVATWAAHKCMQWALGAWRTHCLSNPRASTVQPIATALEGLPSLSPLPVAREESCSACSVCVLC
eukprot:TRINITY_DN17216_c0_g2_i2.p1 TRINITY_DN17216_c0_g2~~TRINITY_DN17216_c0_g2_i2.p1  ORF type:complete len:266 (-),score=40.28 TRINITY_DN17216_c0_g2_i2:122-919(-)